MWQKFFNVICLVFCPTALKGWGGIVFTHGIQMGIYGEAGGHMGWPAATKSLFGLYLKKL